MSSGSPTRARCSPVASLGGPLNITNFTYTRGDLGLIGRNGRPPTVKAGQTLTFRNVDAQKEIWHTITACRAPCNASAGIAYPLANGPVDFDSAELGFSQIPGGRHIGGPPASGTDTWKTPSNLQARHLHLLLPHPSVHARRLPRQELTRPG